MADFQAFNRPLKIGTRSRDEPFQASPARRDVANLRTKPRIKMHLDLEVSGFTTVAGCETSARVGFLHTALIENACNRSSRARQKRFRHLDFGAQDQN